MRDILIDLDDRRKEKSICEELHELSIGSDLRFMSLHKALPKGFCLSTVYTHTIDLKYVDDSYALIWAPAENEQDWFKKLADAGYEGRRILVTDENNGFDADFIVEESGIVSCIDKYIIQGAFHNYELGGNLPPTREETASGRLVELLCYDYRRQWRLKIDSIEGYEGPFEKLDPFDDPEKDTIRLFHDGIEVMVSETKGRIVDHDRKYIVRYELD